MGVRHPAGETVIIHPKREGGVDANGEPVTTWGPDITRERCAVAPHVEAEDAVGNRSMIVNGFDVYDTYDTPAGPHDELTVRGVRCRVDGEIARWADPFRGRQSGAVITVKRVEG